MSRRTAVAIAAAGVILGGLTSTEASETIKKIKERGTLQVCMAETRPRAVRNPANGQWSGYNIELAKDVVASAERVNA